LAIGEQLDVISNEANLLIKWPSSNFRNVQVYDGFLSNFRLLPSYYSDVFN